MWMSLMKITQNLECGRYLKFIGYLNVQSNTQIMNTKICKYCKESILIDASKCPKCQSFQNRFLNPMSIVLLLLFMLPVLMYPLYQSSRKRNIKFVDHQKEIEFNIVRKDTINRSDCQNCDLLNVLLEIENKSEFVWEHGQFNVLFKNSQDEILNVEKQRDFQLILNPRTVIKSSIKVPIYDEYESAIIEVELVDLKHKWY